MAARSKLCHENITSAPYWDWSVVTDQITTKRMVARNKGAEELVKSCHACQLNSSELTGDPYNEDRSPS